MVDVRLVLLPRRTLHLTLLDQQRAAFEPHSRRRSDGDAGAVRGVDALAYFVLGLREPSLRLPLCPECPDVALAVLVKVVGDPGGLDFPAGLPAALADSCHRLPFSKEGGPRCGRPRSGTRRARPGGDREITVPNRPGRAAFLP